MLPISEYLILFHLFKGIAVGMIGIITYIYVMKYTHNNIINIRDSRICMNMSTNIINLK